MSIYCHLILISWCVNSISCRVHLQNHIDVCIHIMIVKKNIYFEIFFLLFFFSVPLVSAMYGKCICIRKCDCKYNVLLPDMATLYAPRGWLSCPWLDPSVSLMCLLWVDLSSTLILNKVLKFIYNVLLHWYPIHIYVYDSL